MVFNSPLDVPCKEPSILVKNARLLTLSYTLEVLYQNTMLPMLRCFTFQKASDAFGELENRVLSKREAVPLRLK